MDILYDYPLYRPPSESNSVIFQVTLGCSFNRCSFCNMYRSKDYSERPWDEIKAEIDLAADSFPGTTRVFLADGDALNLSTNRLEQILSYIYLKFPKIQRVSCYAMPKNLLQKSDDDLKKLRKAGLNMFYIGLESGNDLILKKVTKGATGTGLIQSCNKAKKNGFLISCMIILGLGGQRYTMEHIRDTAKVVSEISPNYLGALTLHLEEGIYDEFMAKFEETFIPLDDFQVLQELERLVDNIQSNESIVFRANHASNVYSLGGNLPEDKEKIISLIKSLKQHPEMLKPKVLRRF